jgi:hypothetical protein
MVTWILLCATNPGRIGPKKAYFSLKDPNLDGLLVTPMRLIAIVAVGLTLLACANRETVYQRSLAAAHPDVPEADFEQIAEILSHHTHQSITNVKTIQNDEVSVHAAFSGEQGPDSGQDFVLVKRDGRWHILNATNTVVE